MNRLLYSALFSLAFTLPSAAGDGPAKESPLAPLAFLAGGKWRAVMPARTEDNPMSIEQQIDWSENRQVLRFESTFVQGSKRTPYVVGMYFWHPSRKQIAFIYADNAGNLIEGAVTRKDDTLVHEFTITDPDSKLTRARAIITLRGPDLYTNEIFVEKDGAFEKVVNARYERKK